MPVINVPQDTRWGDLGKGLGSLIGSVAQGALQAQTAQGIAEIMQDPKVSEADKPVQVLKKFGPQGYEQWKTMQEGTKLQAQIQSLLAGVGKEKVQTSLLQGELDAGKPAADVANTKATTGLHQAQTGQSVAQTATINALRPGQTDLQNAHVTESMANTNLKKSQTEENVFDAKLKEFKYNTMVQAQKNGGAGIDAEVDAFASAVGLPPTDPSVAGLKQIARGAASRGEDPTKAMEPAIKAISERLSKRAEVKPLPEGPAKDAAASAQYATALNTFTQAFASNPAAVGLTSAAGIKGWLERQGIGAGDPTLLQMVETQHQAVGQQAKSGSMFMGTNTINLAKNVVPSVNRSPMASVIALDTIADQQIAELQTRMDNYKGTPFNTEPLQNTINKWNQIKDVTRTFSSGVAYDNVKPDGTPDPASERQVTYFKGKQVDSMTFAPLVERGKKYPVKGGSVTGDELFTWAAQKNMDPYGLLRKLGGR